MMVFSFNADWYGAITAVYNMVPGPTLHHSVAAPYTDNNRVRENEREKCPLQQTPFQ